MPIKVYAKQRNNDNDDNDNDHVGDETNEDSIVPTPFVDLSTSTSIDISTTHRRTSILSPDYLNSLKTVNFQKKNSID